MNHLILTFIIFFTSHTLFCQTNIAVLFNVAQSNNHFDFQDVTGEVYPFSPRINFATSEHVGLSTRLETKANTIFELMVAGAKGQTYHTNGPLDPTDHNYRYYFQNKFDIHFRLEVGKMYTNDVLKNLSIGYTASINPRFTDRYYMSDQSNTHNIKLLTYEVAVNVNPQIEININEKIIFVLKMPVEVLNYLNMDGKYFDPNKNAENQMISREIIDLFYLRPTFALGVGYYFANRNR